jgi:hypothetical protein
MPRQQVVAVDWTAWPVAGGWNGAVADWAAR